MHPYKMVNFEPYFFVLLIILGCLAILTGFQIIPKQIPSKYASFEKIAGIVFLISSIIIINTLLFHFHFTQTVEFIITGSFCLPYPIILKSLTNRIKNNYLVLAGMILFLPTFLYFTFFYERYEDFLNGIPIDIYHYWIRNWLILAGIILILTYSMRLKTFAASDNHEN